MQVSLAQFKGLPSAEAAEPNIALSLDLPDFVEANSPLTFAVEAAGADESFMVSAELESISQPAPPQQIAMNREGDTWQAVVEELAAGYYRLTTAANASGITPVSDIFVVA
jgi:hypothetical protein